MAPKIAIVFVSAAVLSIQCHCFESLNSDLQMLIKLAVFHVWTYSEACRGREGWHRSCWGQSGSLSVSSAIDLD